MSRTTLNVRFYATDAGTEPVRDWLKSLSIDDRKYIGHDIKTIQYGWPLGMPLVRKIDRNLWEIRTSLLGRTARVLFTLEGADMVLVHGFIKKTRQTSLTDLRIAKQRLK